MAIIPVPSAPTDASPQLRIIPIKNAQQVFETRIACINYEPITKKGIQEHNPEIEYIYTGKKGNPLIYRPFAEKKGGTALGTVFEKAHFKPNSSKPCSQWLGKVGMPGGRLRNDPSTVRTRTKKELNVDTIREKLGYDLYQELGRGLFKVPKTRLSTQPIIDNFTADNALAVAWANQGIDRCLRIMSRYMNSEGYLDFKHAKIQDEDRVLSFIEYLQLYHRPPQFLLHEGKQVPLKGLMGMIVVGRVLADTDIIGGSGGNAGFILVKNAAGQIIEAQVVKIDPGEAFKFKLEEPEDSGRIYPSANWVLNTIARREKRLTEGQTLQDLRDVQVAQCDDSVTIQWNALIPEQQREFLAVLLNCPRYLQAEEILKYLFYRDGKFNCNELEKISVEIAEQFQKDMQEWLSVQLDIYKIELEDFQKKYPEELLRIQYIDRYGELPLPTSDETFPIRELYTRLALVERREQKDKDKKSQEVSRNLKIPESDFLYETFDRLKNVQLTISIDELFTSKEPNKPRLRKVLLLGSTGVGKSTLCQKIAHDWASGRLWKEEYQAIYWLPLRWCNGAIKEGGLLVREKKLERWLAKAIGYLVLGQEFLVSILEEQIRLHKQKILILFDGYDEASPELASMVDIFMADSELNILLTSRPGVTSALHPLLDRIVENIGFSDDQMCAYAERFFERRQQGAVHKGNKVAFLAALKSNPHFFSIAHIPLQMQMLCALWEKGKSIFPSTLTGLYEEMVQLLVNWHYQKGGKRAKDIPPKELEATLACLGDIALWGLDNKKLVISEKELAYFAKERLLMGGLLKESQQGSAKEYYFFHLTFQEYLAARFISNSYFQQRFVIMHRYEPQFQLTLSFLAGMISKNGLNFTKEFFGWLHSSGADMTGLTQFELMIRCLDECPDSSLHQWASETYDFKGIVSLLLKINKDKLPISRDKVRKLFQRYPLGLQEIWKELCRLLEDSKNPGVQEAVIEFLGDVGGHTPLQYHDRIASVLIQIIDSGILRGWLIPQFNSTDNRRLSSTKALGEVGKITSGKLYFSISIVLTRALKDQSSDVRCSATYFLIKMAMVAQARQIVAAVKALSEALKDRDSSVRCSVANCLGQLAKVAPAEQVTVIVKSLLEARKDQDPYVCRDVVNALGAVAKVAPVEIPLIVESLLEALKNQDWDVRRNAAQILGTMASIAPVEQIPVIVKTLLDAFKHNDLCVPHYAAEALGKVAKVLSKEQILDITKTLLIALRDQNYQTLKARRSAAEALSEVAKVTPTELIPLLVKSLLEALEDPDYKISDIRYFAAKTFIEIAKTTTKEQVPAILKALSEALKDLDSAVRRSAAEALVNLETVIPTEQIPDIIEGLLEARKHDDSIINFYYSAEALGKAAKLVSVEQIHVIVKALLEVKKKPMDFFVYPLRAFVKVAEAASVEQMAALIETLSKCLNDQDLFISCSSADVLGEIAKEASAEQISIIIKLLSKVLKDHHSRIRCVKDQNSEGGFKWNRYDIHRNAVYALSEIAKVASVEHILAVVEALSECLQHQLPFYRKIQGSFSLLSCRDGIFSATRISGAIITLVELQNNREFCVRDAAYKVLGKLAKAIPAEIEKALLEILENQTSYNCEIVARAFNFISLKKYLKIVANSNLTQLTSSFIERVINRSSPLFIQDINNIPHLCFIENNQIIQQQITPEQVQYFKNWSRTGAPLRPYTSCYLK